MVLETLALYNTRTSIVTSDKLVAIIVELDITIIYPVSSMSQKAFDT
jgi:hypothetical protein